MLHRVEFAKLWSILGNDISETISEIYAVERVALSDLRAQVEWKPYTLYIVRDVIIGCQRHLPYPA